MEPAFPGKPIRHGRVVIIDDDTDVLDSLGMVLEHAGYHCERHIDGLRFLQTLKDGYHPIEARGCILCDVKMPSMDGLALQRELAERSNWPLILMSGACTPQDVVDAFHGGVVDFLVKPFDNATLLGKIERALSASDDLVSTRRRQLRLVERVKQLTPQEREIARRVVAGHSSARIAQDLNIALRTVKLHRSRMMEKLGVESVEAFLEASQLVELSE